MDEPKHYTKAWGDLQRDRMVRYIGDFVAHFGYSPTFRQVATSVGLSINVTFYHLSKLAAEGRVTWEAKSPRTLRLVDSTPADAIG